MGIEIFLFVSELSAFSLPEALTVVIIIINIEPFLTWQSITAANYNKIFSLDS
ncbi:MAG: hypothetical protein PHR06_14175 [Candidatus Cloacimonetes bacterium]|nr:hypothetical protein [Candidatus Cloacimonadota bacterium]